MAQAGRWWLFRLDLCWTFKLCQDNSTRPASMASIYGFSLPDGFLAGASLKLSKEPCEDQRQDIYRIHGAIRSGQSRIHVALPRIWDTAASDYVMWLILPAA